MDHDPWPDSANLTFAEELYTAYLADPGSVPESWRRWFAGLSRGDPFVADPALGPRFEAPRLFSARNGHGAYAAPPASETALQDRVNQLVRAYHVRGHMIAELDPLGRPRDPQPELEPAFYGLTEADLDAPIRVESVESFSGGTLRELIAHLRATYCRRIGVQFMHIDELAVKNWLRARMESTENRLQLSRAEQMRVLTRLTDAVVFEEFIQKKYLGAKSFSLEGCESLIPLLHLAIEKAAEQGIDEVVLGMAHRGRLNVLANILGKSPAEIFRLFEDPEPERWRGGGDVKYHLGHSSDWRTASGREVHLSLCFNPSHLEFVNPVALGRMRAKQDEVGDAARERGLALLIHGDAAFAGEGIVQETLNMSQLPGYAVGGTLHVVVNNQIGFTTTPEEGRSSTYATDVAKLLQIPIFHVNGEDPEAVAQVVTLALDFRKRFRRDVILDMYGYRRRGHNEGDEPAFTQPRLYRAIQARKPVREGYLDHLLELGGIERGEAEALEVARREELERHLSHARGDGEAPADAADGEACALESARSEDDDGLGDAPRRGAWSGYLGGPDAAAPEVETGVPREQLVDLLERMLVAPPDLRIHPKLARLLSARREMADGKRPLDWAAGELLAYASLAVAGHRVRLTGQDSGRGTFSHRHALIHDMSGERVYEPLNHLAPDQAPVEIVNSPLSEAGVLGFEYGYSLDAPDGLVLWEAQFGDFCNAAQVIIDQFIVSAEAKWNRLSGVVLLLPHGFEGMGPEHSSARLERFLMLAVQDNVQVVNPTTPAQMFHCLRRQVLRPWRKPLIVMTPKSLLRHKRATSPLADLAWGGFRRILPDGGAAPPEGARRVLLCSGKIAYELEEERERRGAGDVAILRLEQLYPLADEALRSALAPYGDGTPVVWVQEEPENMGAWSSLSLRFGNRLFGRLPFRGVSRPPSASPATGSAGAHRLEQDEILERAFEEEA